MANTSLPARRGTSVGSVQPSTRPGVGVDHLARVLSWLDDAES